MKALDLPLVWETRVAEREPCDEDGEKARPVRQRRCAVENSRQSERKHRIEALDRQWQPPQQRQQRQRSGEPHGRADPHLDGELPDDDEPRCVIVSGKLDQTDHQGDPGRIVHSRFALQGRAGAAGDLAAAEHGEHDCRIGGRQSSTDQPGQRPVEPERVMREHGQDAGGRKRP